jgi:hypothetical protein
VVSPKAYSRRVVAEAEKLAATHFGVESVASASLDCGEPYMNHQPNTHLCNGGKPNFRCGKVWLAIGTPFS